MVFNIHKTQILHEKCNFNDNYRSSFFLIQFILSFLCQTQSFSFFLNQEDECLALSDILQEFVDFSHQLAGIHQLISAVTVFPLKVTEH